eukprot:724166-Rhodomonas_salina.2
MGACSYGYPGIRVGCQPECRYVCHGMHTPGTGTRVVPGYDRRHSFLEGPEAAVLAFSKAKDRGFV